MSTWRMEQEVEEVEEVEEVKDSGAAESCLARNVASFGIVVGDNYTPGRMFSE
jgi:hypothetical protein